MVSEHFSAVDRLTTTVHRHLNAARRKVPYCVLTPVEPGHQSRWRRTCPQESDRLAIRNPRPLDDDVADAFRAHHQERGGQRRGSHAVERRRSRHWLPAGVPLRDRTQCVDDHWHEQQRRRDLQECVDATYTPRAKRQHGDDGNMPSRWLLTERNGRHQRDDWENQVDRDDRRWQLDQGRPIADIASR